jgi:hypothetical protein
MKNADWSLRQSAALSAAGMDSPKITASLVSALDDSHYLVRAGAIYGLQDKVSRPPRTAEAAIKPYLNDPEWQVRQAAVISLSKAKSPEIMNLLIPRLDDSSTYVRGTTKFALAKKLVTNPDLLINYPRLKELEPFIKEYQSKPGAIVVVFEGWDNLNPLDSVRKPGWSNNLLLRNEIELIGRLSGGKVEFREGNWSGNMVFNTKDVQDNAKFLYQAWKDAKDTNRNLYVIGNSYANKIVPAAFELAQTAYKNPRIKADLFIGTGYPGRAILINVEHLRKASIREPIIIGSNLDWAVFSIPYAFKRESSAQYTIFPHIKHAGLGGYFDHPDSVITILDKMGFTAPLPSRIKDYSGLTIPSNYLQKFNAPSYGLDYLKTPIVPQLPGIINQQPITPSVNQPMPIYTLKPVYTPQRGSWPGQYNFNIRAPDNYWRQQQFNVPHTPIVPSAPIYIPPAMPVK